MDENIPIIPPDTTPLPDIPVIHKSDWAPLIFATSLLFVIVVFILSRFGNIKKQAWYVTIACTIGWFFPFWIVFLLPLDLASTVHDDKKGRVPFAYVSQSFLFVAWRVIYWTSFCLTWFTIPMMQAYVNTGDFTITKRLKSAVNVNIRFYSMYVIVGIVGLVYLIFGSGLTTREGIQSYVMAAANSWGLFLVIVFMGYGLVSVPRTLWYSGSYDRHLHQHYANATKLKEECLDSELEFNELAKTMNAISKRTMMEIPEIRYCINTMVRRFPFVLHETYGERNNSFIVPRDLTEEYLVDLSKRMILAIRIRDRKNALWNNLLSDAFYLQDVINNKDKSDRKFVSTLRHKKEETLWTKFVSTMEWWWILRISPNLYKILAVFFSCISVCIIWSELTFNVRRPAILSIAYYALNACGTNYAALEIMAFFTLLYMCICVYSSLFKIRFFNLYLLIPNHHTDENSLLWFTSYMCKMMAPLCYNYINLAVDAPGVSKAVFTTFMGKTELIKFLGSFTDWFPIIILIPSLALLFNVQGRCLGFCGIKNPYEGSDDDNQEDPEANNGGLLDADYEEGAKLIQEERRAKEREINPSARVITHAARNREYTNKKYHRASPPDTLRTERDRRVDEILSGRTSQQQHHSNYRDHSPTSSDSSALSVNENQNDHIDSMQLKTNLMSFGDTVKHKLGGLFGSKTAPSENNNTSSPSPPPPPPKIAEPENNISTYDHPSPSHSTGRVLGRPSSTGGSSITNDRPYKDVRTIELTEEDIPSRSNTPSPFLVDFNRINRQPSHNSNASPFARFDGVSRLSPTPPPQNMFDDI